MTVTGAPTRTRTRRPRAVPVRRRIFGDGHRPGFLTYGLLSAFFLASAYPLWWSVIIGSRSNEALGRTWPPLLR